MIINIRGTSGAGKTHLVRRIMSAAGGEPAGLFRVHPVRGRELRVGYHYGNAGVTVIGDYAANCSGCDKYSWRGAADWVQEAVSIEAALGRHVVFEGARVSQWALARFMALRKVAPLTVVVLSTPLEDCLNAVRARRAAQGNDEPLSVTSTTDRWNAIKRAGYTHQLAGLDVERLDRDAAYARCCELLNLKPEAS